MTNRDCFVPYNDELRTWLIKNETKNADTLVGIPTEVSGLRTINADTLVGIPTVVSGLKTKK